MIAKKEILSRLRQIRADLFRRYGLSALGLFGSYAREEATELSDIDLLVEFARPVGFEIVDLAIELEEILYHPVDLASRNGIPPRLLPYIKDDIIYV